MRARDSTTRFVRPSVGPRLTFLMILFFLVSLLPPKWSSDLKYGPCPSARDLGSRVSSLVIRGSLGKVEGVLKEIVNCFSKVSEVGCIDWSTASLMIMVNLSAL